MFFKTSHFRKVCDENTARTVAAVANEIIDKNGKVLYGNLFKDGTASNFSTDKQEKDTHVSIAIGMDEMGLFDDDREIHIDSADSDEIALVTAQRNEILEREIRKLREANAKAEVEGPK